MMSLRVTLFGLVGLAMAQEAPTQKIANGAVVDIVIAEGEEGAQFNGQRSKVESFSEISDYPGEWGYRLEGIDLGFFDDADLREVDAESAAQWVASEEERKLNAE